MENGNNVDVKSVIIEYPKASRKLSKAIRQAEKVSQLSSAGKISDSSLYNETKKQKKFWINKMQK